MTDNKKAAPVWQLEEAAPKSFCYRHFTQFSRRVRAAIYRLAP